MISGKKKRKLLSGEGFTLGENENLNMSIGNLLQGGRREDKITDTDLKEKKNIKSKIYDKKDDRSGISDLRRVVLQRQTAGRKGKVVTAVIIPKDSHVNREALAKEMRKGLGCGSFVEDSNVVLQGDICDRAREWLLKKGVKEISSGN